MNFSIDANIFIGCNKRFMHLSAKEKMDETLAVVQHWTAFSCQIKKTSLRLYFSPEAVPVIADISARMGKEINCIILPSANGIADSIKAIAQTSLKHNKNSIILLSNNVYFPGLEELIYAAKGIKSNKSHFFVFSGEKKAYDFFPRLIFSLEDQPIGSVPKYIAGLSRLLAKLFAQTDKGESISAKDASQLAVRLIGSEPAARSALRGLYEHLESAEKLSRSDLNRFFTIDDRIVNLCSGVKLTGAEIERSSFVDLGVYLIAPELMPDLVLSAANNKLNAFRSEIDLIGCAALIDAVEIDFQLVQSPKPNDIAGEAPADSMKTPEIQSPQKRQYALSDSGENRLRTWLLEAYGLDKSLIKEKIEYLNFIFELFFYHFGAGEMSLGRAATPVELLGRHLDNFGGMINTAAISRECQVLCRQTEREEIRIRSTAPAISPDLTIPITKTLKDCCTAGDWREILKNQQAFEIVSGQSHQWTQIVLATVLRIFNLHNTSLSGLDILIANSLTVNSEFNIRTSLAFALAQSLVHLQGHEFSEQQIYTIIGDVFRFLRLELPQREITTLACARAGKILPIQFSPIAIAKYLQFPDACRLLYCHSGVQQTESGIPQNLVLRLKDTIPRCLKIVERERSQPGMQINYIRDLLPKKLAVSVDEFYRLMRQVPEHVTDALFQNKVAESSTTANGREQTKTVAQLLPVRNALIYLIGEYCRCRELIVRLNVGDVDGAGRLLRISHDGERVAVRKNGRLEKYRLQYTDELLTDLQKIAEQSPESVALYEQSGAIHTSSPEIDELVDVLHSIHGVLGAHISGTGAGGGAIALVEKGAVETCIERLDQEYYQPRGFEKRIISSRPVSGSSGINFTQEELCTTQV